MNTEIVPFVFDDRQVRTVLINGEPWFVATDVCGILEIESARDAVRSLPRKGVATTDTLTQGGPQKVKVVNEPNLYRLIFRSRKPEAEKFQDWIYETVIPTLRKTGQYSIAIPGITQTVLVQSLLSVCFCRANDFPGFRPPRPRPTFPERWLLFRLVV